MTPPSETVRVALRERGYDIQIGTGNFSGVAGFLGSLARVSHAVVITDVNVEDPHADALVRSLAESGVAVDLLVVEAGEASKSIETATALWTKMLALGTDRKSVVVAVGGGVIGDLAGFVAATYARGVQLLQVPTSLLAQVDSSVGGKVGVNLPDAKNIVGSFWQPMGVFIDTAVLDTLPEREYRAGLAEVVKYGVILDGQFFAYLESHVTELNGRNGEVLRQAISQSCRLKAQVVELDEREETGRRAVLNYGHTFCHALETVTGYGEYLHGEAVSIGMIRASVLAERIGRINPDVTRRQEKLLSDLGLPTQLPKVDTQRMLAAMSRDKKVEHGKLRFVLPTKIGHVELVGNVDPEDVRGVLGK